MNKVDGKDTPGTAPPLRYKMVERLKVKAGTSIFSDGRLCGNAIFKSRGCRQSPRVASRSPPLQLSSLLSHLRPNRMRDRRAVRAVTGRVLILFEEIGADGKGGHHGKEIRRDGRS